MTHKEELDKLRKGIDGTDSEIVRLFQERMRISERIAEVKAEGNIAIADHGREQQVIDAALAAADGENRAETIALMRTLIALSKIRQTKKLMLSSPVDFPPSAERKGEGVAVAFQGVTGAWGEQGAARLFPDASLRQCDSFEDVFAAVRAGEADYGVLPIENSQTGAIGEVYDLLRKHSCYIVGEVWITVAQCLLAPAGASLSDIREVLSHPEGFNQCRRFLRNRNWDLTACRNTAVAAQAVAEKGGTRQAAIGSRRAAEVYGLQLLAPDIMDNPNNKTRFISIAAEPVYDEGCSAVSITFSTAHRSGALCAVLQSFMLAGINLTRIDSRPVAPDRYRFFADLEANILSGETLDALRQASAQCDYFEILGCYPAAER